MTDTVINIDSNMPDTVLNIDSTDLEFHFPGLNYCGPGTDLTKRLEADGVTPRRNFMPVDRIDEISLRHDLYYTAHTSARERIIGDDIMFKELNEIPNPTWKERFERIIVRLLLGAKRWLVVLWFYIIDRCFPV